MTTDQSETRAASPMAGAVALAAATIDLAPSVAGDRTSLILRHGNPQDHIFRIVQRTRTFYEIDLLRELAGRLAPGDLVVDVGANIGNHSLFFAAVCGCRVLALEPNPEAYALLLENISANGLGDRIIAIQAAAGAAPGEAHIESPDPCNLGAARTVTGSGPVRVLRLDGIRAARGARLIKIDVEGAELEVLLGAAGLLGVRRKPILTAEAPSQAGFAALDRLLGRYGYIATGTLAFTPTHLFEAVSSTRWQALLAAIGRAAAQHAIATHELRGEVQHLRRRLAALEAAEQPPME